MRTKSSVQILHIIGDGRRFFDSAGCRTSERLRRLLLPPTEPARCRGEGSGGRTPPRGCPWTVPGWSRPWPSIRCASRASPETTVGQTQTIRAGSAAASWGRTRSESSPTFPQGESHDGSPGLEAFHRAKSLGDFFSLSLSAEMLRSPEESFQRNRRTGLIPRSSDT